MKNEFDARRLDIRRFAEERGVIEATQPLSAFRRLLDEAEGRGTDEPVRWSARGELLDPGHVQPDVWLHLEASTRLTLTCQRCLQPVRVPLEVRRSFRFVRDESTAASEDEASEEDVLAESRSFDLLELAEDELLMELPLAPRHERCPVELPMTAGEAEFEATGGEKARPFEALGKLKSTRH
ncbi:MAG TPA: DUF177 domain-containing protein [Ramlibacter sp.]|uniref:DUF177 domain-containing protein n=1 Tax=Ramlibacter sp. TaxID=1917967 RepID=UPI002BDA0632|nr:DUF177 domain-containing protein [Ramlibacter sp.]HVZ45319.1 DUF177 domain-containing protein [Ramlibacter sp.]